MRKGLMILAWTTAIAVPAGASAQHGGGHGGGGGFHAGAGFHGGGFRGAGFRGGFRGGYGHGYRGYPYGGFYGLYGGLGLGFGLGAIYAGEFYSPWSYYYPWSYTTDYDYGSDGFYDGESNDPPAPRNYRDPWTQSYGATATPAAPVACGRWIWNAQTSRYTWNDDNC